MVGAVFSIIAITTSIGYVTYSMHLLDSYTTNFLATNQERTNTQKEQFQISKVSLINNRFNITVQNTGEIPINITRLYVQNTTATDWFGKYSINADIPPGSKVSNIGTTIPLSALSAVSYDMKIATSRGNTEEFFVNSGTKTPLSMQLFTTPSTVPSGFTTTVILAVTNNMSSSTSIANLTPNLSVVSLGASANLVSGPTPTSYGTLQSGSTAYFQWDYTVTGNSGQSVKFNATIQNAYPGNFVYSTVAIGTVPTAGQSQTSLQSKGLSALSVNDNVLILHQETTNALNGYQTYSASADTTGKIIQLDTTTPIFYTNNDTTTITIPSGQWVHTLRYLSSPIPSTIATTPSMIFHFEDGSSSVVAKDSTGNTLGLTLGVSGSKPTWSPVNGMNGSAGFAFAGGQYMDNSITSFNNIGTFDTTSGWFKTSYALRQVMIRMGSSGDNSPFYEVGLDTGSNSGRVLFRFSDNSNGIVDGNCESPIGKSYADGNWHHFVAEKTGNAKCTLYVDGVSVVTNTSTCSCTFVSISTSNKISIGRDDSTSGKNYFNGNLDDVLHWNGVNLTSPQITDLYKTNYGTSAHTLTFIFDVVDKDGNFIQHVNTTSIANIPLNFADSFGVYSSPTNTSWGLYNFTFNAPAITLNSNQRLKIQEIFVSQSGAGQLNLKFDIDNLSIGGTSTLNSLVQIPEPTQTLPGYYTYASGGDGTVNVYNSGPYMAWMTANSRVVFESLDGTKAYASWTCGFSGFPHSASADSLIITVGNYASICFTKPATQPGTDSDQGGILITPGNYRMYIYINGYDQKGNIFVGTEYIGPVKVT